jgi:PAS domain-containing protein
MDASSTEPSYDLAGSEARLRLATDAAAIGIWTWEIATEAVYWSEQCFAIFGVSSFQGVRDDFANAVHPDDAPALWEQVADAIASRRQFRAEFSDPASRRFAALVDQPRPRRVRRWRSSASYAWNGSRHHGSQAGRA